MKQIALSRLPELLESLAARGSLYCPLDDGTGASRFARWEPGREPVLTGNPRLGPKDLFFPQVEDLMRFRVSGKELEILEAQVRQEPFVVFGVRACDCRALEILDRVFLAEPEDSFYRDRREHGAVVSLACQEPEETCFCGTFGIDAGNPAGDVSAWQWEDTLYFRANTEKGAALLAELPLEEGGETAVEQAQGAARAIQDRLPLRGLTTEGFGRKEAMLELFHRPEWDRLSESCLGCGACTFVCPTCQCYDIKDYDTGRGVQRYRCWDSCMYSDFTMMAHGNNRTSQMQRFRQRFMHKLAYFPANNDGMFSCVGCGRCVDKCPSRLNIVKVIRAFEQEGNV